MIERVSGIGVAEYFTDMGKLLEIESENYVNTGQIKRQLSLTDSNNSDKSELKSLITPSPSLVSFTNPSEELKKSQNNDNLEKAIKEINITTISISRQNSKQTRKPSFMSQKSLSGANDSVENNAQKSSYKRMNSKSFSSENDQSVYYHELNKSVSIYSNNNNNNNNSAIKEFLLYFILVV